jgi:hypothetical protein
MVNRAIGEAFAHRQPGVASADHDGGYRSHWQRLFSVQIV